MITLALLLTTSFSTFALAGDAEPAPATAAPTAASPADAALAIPVPTLPAAPPVAAPEAAAPEAAAPEAAAEAPPRSHPRFGLEVAVGAQGTGTSSFDPGGVRGTFGLTGRLQLTRALALDLGLTHSLNGGTRSFDVESADSAAYYEDEEYQDEEYYDDCYDCYPSLYASTQMMTERLDFGLRAELPIWSAFRPYAKVAAIGALSIARLDEDTEDTENPTQLSRAGFTGGGYFAAGFSTPIRLNDTMHILPSVEAGYSAIAPVTLGDLGAIKQSGCTFRFSSGITF